MGKLRHGGDAPTATSHTTHSQAPAGTGQAEGLDGETGKELIPREREDGCAEQRAPCHWWQCLVRCWKIIPDKARLNKHYRSCPTERVYPSQPSLLPKAGQEAVPVPYQGREQRRGSAPLTRGADARAQPPWHKPSPARPAPGKRTQLPPHSSKEGNGIPKSNPASS